MPRSTNLLEHETQFGRLDTFSDAIFAVAMTLLVFSFPLSDLRPNIGQAAVEGLILSLATQFETFVISFIVVGAFCTAHHSIFDRIIRYDRPLVWINFMFLLCIVFIPFPTALVVRYNYWITTAFYAASIAAAGFVLALLWQYASRHYRLIDRGLSRRYIHVSTVRSLVTPIIFLLSIPVAYVTPRFAPYVWLFSFVVEWAVIRPRGGRSRD